MSDSFKPPPGPPPVKEQTQYDAPPAYTHPWQMVPEANEDHSELPPPPGFRYDNSTANASRDDADRAHNWTDANPLWPARVLSDFDRKSLSVGYSSLIRPPELAGTTTKVKPRPGVWLIDTQPECQDCCLVSSQPLYSPFRQQTSAYADTSAPAAAKAAEAGVSNPDAPRLAYYEIKIIRLASDSGVAVGFVAPPYPTWRLPGWERASLGVHGDDGRRFVNDTWGGRNFTKPFEAGEIIGIGLEVTAAAEMPPNYDHSSAAQGGGKHKSKNLKTSGTGLDVNVFLTRNGRRVGEWDLHEPVDAAMDQPGGVTGLEGVHDIHGAIGVYGSAQFEVWFGRHNWMYMPGR